MASIKGKPAKQSKPRKRRAKTDRMRAAVEQAVERGRGQPTKYDPKYVPIARKMAKLGAIDRDFAEAFEVSLSTIKNWKASEEAFLEATKVPKIVADEKVERSLLERAMGYNYDAVKIFCSDGVVTKVDYVEHVPPEVAACIFWLKNRQPDKWKDKREYEAGDLKVIVEGGLPK